MYGRRFNDCHLRSSFKKSYQGFIYIKWKEKLVVVAWEKQHQTIVIAFIVDAWICTMIKWQPSLFSWCKLLVKRFTGCTIHTQTLLYYSIFTTTDVVVVCSWGEKESRQFAYFGFCFLSWCKLCVKHFLKNQPLIQRKWSEHFTMPNWLHDFGFFTKVNKFYQKNLLYSKITIADIFLLKVT